jgi:hypothetical protein
LAIFGLRGGEDLADGVDTVSARAVMHGSKSRAVKHAIRFQFGSLTGCDAPLSLFPPVRGDLLGEEGEGFLMAK